MQLLSATIESTLQTVVSSEGSVPAITLRHVVFEAWRTRNTQFPSPPFQQYVAYAKLQGNIMQELHARFYAQVESLFQFIQLYQGFVAKNSPMVKFYSERYPGLGKMLGDVGYGDEQVIRFFQDADTAKTNLTRR
jgi:hypothetical protein